VKGTTTINASSKAIKNILRDPNQHKNFSQLLQLSQVVEEIDSHTQILYMIFGTKICIIKQCKDVVVLYHWYDSPDGSIVLVGSSIEHLACPVSQEYHRAKVLRSGYIISPLDKVDTQCKVSFINHVDLTGGPSVISFLRTQFMNVVQERQPLALSRLKKYVEEKEKIDKEKSVLG